MELFARVHVKILYQIGFSGLSQGRGRGAGNGSGEGRGEGVIRLTGDKSSNTPSQYTVGSYAHYTIINL